MNTAAKVAIGVVILVVIGAATFFFINRDSGDTSTDTNNSTQQQATTATETQEQESEQAAAVAIDDALAAIAASCQPSGATESTCTYKGKEYTLTKPSNWSNDGNLRKQACEQGYVNSNYQILSNGSSFYFTTDNNEDLQSLSTALNNAGAEVTVVAYCG